MLTQPKSTSPSALEVAAPIALCRAQGRFIPANASSTCPKLPGCRPRRSWKKLPPWPNKNLPGIWRNHTSCRNAVSPRDTGGRTAAVQSSSIRLSSTYLRGHRRTDYCSIFSIFISFQSHSNRASFLRRQNESFHPPAKQRLPQKSHRYSKLPTLAVKGWPRHGRSGCIAEAGRLPLSGAAKAWRLSQEHIRNFMEM